MNISEIRKLVEIIKENDLTEFELDEGEFSIRIRRGSEHTREYVQAPVHMPISAVAPAPVATLNAASSATTESGFDTIKSPMVGTFYRSPSPDSEPFASEGKKVTPDSVVCIIEAMKVMNEIQSEKTGTIVDVLVKDGDPVEFGQPLFKIKL